MKNTMSDFFESDCWLYFKYLGIMIIPLVALFVIIGYVTRDYKPTVVTNVIVIPQVKTMYIYDGCQYIGFSGNSMSMTHKGNCTNHVHRDF